MTGSGPIYVVDTNILVDYVDILPLSRSKNVTLREPTINLSEAHIVIPTAVIRELSSFKKEKSERGMAARVALRRLRELSEGRIQTMGDAYNLNAPILMNSGKQRFSILPVHAKFKKALPFMPSEDDMDGQIILAALSVTFILKGLPIDGTAQMSDVLSFESNGVVLLTNDNGLAIRARERGIKTSRYGYKYPEQYTGRRDVVVPKELFSEFISSKKLSSAEFERMMPDERPLVANEFIVMKVADELDYPSYYDPEFDPYFSNIGRYDADTDMIVPLKYVSSFPVKPRNPGQAIYAEALTNPDFAAVICTGPAGCGKTFMATVYGYNACKDGEFIGVTVIPCESHSKIGALPGDLDEKMDPDVQPLKNALRNYLLIDDSKLRKELDTLKKFGTDSKSKKNGDSSEDDNGSKQRSIKAKLKDRVDLIWENWFSSIPIENARGRDFAYELAVYDEFQDQNVSQADTLIKRLGSDGKIIITGDIEQIHAPYLDRSNNGLVYASRLMYDNPMVAQVCFTEEEIIRHPLVRAVATRQRERTLTSKNLEP